MPLEERKKSFINPYKPGIPTIELKWKKNYVTIEALEYSLTKYIPSLTFSKLASKTFPFENSVIAASSF